MIKKKINNCGNFNHGKNNPPVKYCPTCGEQFKSNSTASCSDENHRTRLKERHLFCCDCGKDLRK